MSEVDGIELPGAHELHELEEHAQNQEHRRVGLVVSILAILLAVCSALGHKAHTHEIVSGVNASNTWSYYQAKKLRRYQSDIGRDILVNLPGAKAAALAAKYDENRTRYDEESKELAEKAEGYTREGERWEHRGDRFDLGEIFLQIAVVLCSISILTDVRTFVYGGVGFSLLGVAVAASGFLL